MSNLLKDASILLTPTGYENGRMNAIKPSKDLYGSEEITNGDFATDSNWSKGAGWTISGGTANSSGVGGTLQQTSVLVIGKSYKITCEANAVTNLLAFTGFSNSLNDRTIPNGNTTFLLTANSTTFGVFSNGIASIDNISVVEDLTGDFNFQRNSAATRVNAQGLVENVQILSPELVSNGNFSQIGTEEVLNGNFSQQGSELVTNGDFATDSNWNIVNNTGTASEIINGYARIKTDGAYTQIDQPNVTIAAKSYKLQYTISESDGGSLGFIITGNQTASIPTTVGTHIYYFVANSTSIVFKRFSGVLDVKIDNVSVKEVGQNWTLGSGWSIGDDEVLGDGTSFTFLTQNLNLINKNLKLTFEIKDYQSGTFRLPPTDRGDGLDVRFSGNGTQTVYYQSTLNTFRFQQQAFNGSITNISVKEVGQDWSLGTGWSVDQANGKAVFDSGADSAIQQSSVLTSGLKYKLSIDVLDRTTGSLQVRFGNTGSVDETISANGTFTYILISDGTSLYFRATGGFDGSITNISVKEITDDTNIPRINYEGFSYQDSLGSEEIVNGDFATDSDWAKNNGATISGGKGNIIGDGSSFTNLLQANVFTIGKKYKVTVDVTINSGLGLKFQDGATNSNFGTATTSGSYTFYGVANNSNLVIGRKTGGTAFDSSIDNVSVKEYLGQEVVPDSGCGSWLLEGQSTNLITYSEDFSQWSATGSTTIESGYLAPDGTLNAYKVSGSGSTLQFNNITNQTDTRTIYARTISGSGLLHLCSFNGNTNNLFTITEQWQRFEVNGAISTGASTFYAVDFRGSSTLTEVILWGGQAEAISYATSYIPTNGAANTRLQDIATNSGNSSLINSTEGVLYADIAALANDGVPRKISLSDGDGNPQIALGYDAVSNQIRAIVFDGTFPVDVVLSTTNYDVLEYHKVAIKYKSGDSSLWVDGTEVQTSTNAFTITSALNNLNFDDGSGSSDFFGKNKALAVYKEALTDANLRCLTYPNPVATTFDLDFDTIAEQFTFTRGSEATFVNAQGLIESTNQLGPELVVNGDFSNGYVGWGLSGNPSNYSVEVVDHDGKTNALHFTTPDNNSGVNQIILQSNKPYLVKFDLKVISGNVYVGKAGNNVTGGTLNPSEWTTYEEYWTSSDDYFRVYSSGSAEFYLDNVSVKEHITATNTPRIDYSTGAEAFLLEPQRTNIINYSNVFNDIAATLTPDYGISPDGTQNSTRVQTSGSNSGVRISVFNSSNNAFAYSTYVKGVSGESVNVRVETSPYSLLTQYTFILNGEWQRIENVLTASATHTQKNFYLTKLGGSTATDFQVYGAQVEEGSYATSYIPTDGATATRNQEVCKDATPVINSEEGTLYAEISALADGGSNRVIRISDGGGNTNVIEFRYAPDGHLNYDIWVGGVSQFSGYYTSFTQTNENKIAIKYKENDFALWVNGTEVATDTSGVTFSANTLNDLSFSRGPQFNFFGNAKGLKYYPKALADVQLEDLTTI